ncbi:MAG TPA: dihydrolipoyl dehydrogenase [Lentisphaeria bacterium]|nr:MAG: dihydrolipoyl dehydrogenase [Lentisphaerae bacterium GWF2_49_21]HBC88193.1 dihydrolipoyl dehydrogenase [Lentisphaeria bacterium]
MPDKFDICVIGAGPGGYVAAIRAAQNGAKVAIIEKEYLGGTCLNWGCIPTKTLIASAEVLHKAKTASDFGIKIDGNVSPDWPAMLGRKTSVVEKLRGGIGMLLKNAGVTAFTGSASFADRKTINVAGTDGRKEKVSADKFIIASGSEPAMPGFIPKSKRIITSTEILSINEIPKSLLVLGGGVIGCEFACLFAELGTKVTVVEMMPNILPLQDKELSRILSREMKARGIEIFVGSPMEKIEADGKSVNGVVGKEKISADYMLVSIGRIPVTKSLNLAAAGIAANEKGWIPVDTKCRTSVPGIYAIGDVTGRVQLAHFASAMGLCAADNATGKDCEFREDLVPGCIFTSPEIGTVGLSEEQCKEKNIAYNVGKFPFAALGKAMAINETSGFCKIIADSATDQVIGVHIAGPHATDLISEAVTAMNLEVTAKALGKAIHAHPTLGEAMMEAAHAVHGESVHMLAPRKHK